MRVAIFEVQLVPPGPTDVEWAVEYCCVRRDVLLHNPNVSGRILMVGAVIHFALCLKLYGRRGYPEVDPFWLAMVWMWIPPVVLSSVYVRWGKRRLRALVLYSLAAGFVTSWSTVMLVPSYKTPVDAIIGLPFYWPLQLVAVLVVAIASHAALRLFRRLAQRPVCEECGYSIVHLTEPRCPECGTPFSTELLDLDSAMCVPVTRKRWTRLLVVLAVLSSGGFPFVYRHVRIETLANRGRDQAEQDWVANKVNWHMTWQELCMIPGEQVDVDQADEVEVDSVSALMKLQMRRDWEYRTWESAYREKIEEKMHNAGLRPRSLD